MTVPPPGPSDPVRAARTHGRQPASPAPQVLLRRGLTLLATLVLTAVLVSGCASQRAPAPPGASPPAPMSRDLGAGGKDERLGAHDGPAPPPPAAAAPASTTPHPETTP